MTDEIIPFGKYKGQPVEVLAQDHAYLQWLTGQSWFRERYAPIYTLIVNNFREPDETPEHNALQTRFLDELFIHKFICRLAETRLRENYLRRLSNLSVEEKSNEKVLSAIAEKKFPYYSRRVEFEVAGADVVIWIYQARPYVNRDTLSIMDEFEPPPNMKADYRIEIKPSLGDDFPAVLRQMKASGCNILVIDQYAGSGATIEHVIEIFRLSRIRVISIDEILEFQIGVDP